MASKVDNMFAASRFVLPEQRELYLQIKEDEKLIRQPVLEQDELESFHYMIRDSAREDYAITVTWWKQVKGQLGKTCSMWGVIKWIDQNGRRIKLVNDEDSQWIMLDSIIAVTS
ncbi:YolD-like family protein [Brevibacillus nitrificans]|uniref:YolD-like family protein n=1 Tax=Brevibacillus nitrificans TaxID=651560 RepID=UPI002E1E1194|nr:YolD-like family protein [Brevibacillus nitrificans]